MSADHSFMVQAAAAGMLVRLTDGRRLTLRYWPLNGEEPWMAHVPRRQQKGTKARVTTTAGQWLSVRPEDVEAVLVPGQAPYFVWAAERQPA